MNQAIVSLKVTSCMNSTGRLGASCSSSIAVNIPFDPAYMPNLPKHLGASCSLSMVMNTLVDPAYMPGMKCCLGALCSTDKSFYDPCNRL